MLNYKILKHYLQEKDRHIVSLTFYNVYIFILYVNCTAKGKSSPYKLHSHMPQWSRKLTSFSPHFIFLHVTANTVRV